MAVYLLLIRTADGQRLDQQALDRRALANKPTRYAIHTLLETIGAGMLVVVLATLIGVALMRRRPALALIAAVTIGGAALWTELLKHTLFRPAFVFAEPFGNTFPSGHTTVAFSVGVAATLVASPQFRRLVALGAVLYGAAVGIAVVAAGWHRPSDVAGAYLVVTGWAAVVALVSAARFPGVFAAAPASAPPPPGAITLAPRHLLLGALALAGAYIALLAAVLARRGGEIHWTLPGKPFLAASAALVVLVSVLMLALIAGLRAATANARSRNEYEDPAPALMPNTRVGKLL